MRRLAVVTGLLLTLAGTAWAQAPWEPLAPGVQMQRSGSIIWVREDRQTSTVVTGFRVDCHSGQATRFQRNVFDAGMRGLGTTDSSGYMAETPVPGTPLSEGVSRSCAAGSAAPVADISAPKVQALVAATPAYKYTSPALSERAARTAAVIAAVPGVGCAENGSCYGDISTITGKPKTVSVQGYTRKDGTYVRGHMRSK